jgi:hypothetical protein
VLSLHLHPHLRLPRHLRRIEMIAGSRPLALNSDSDSELSEPLQQSGQTASNAQQRSGRPSAFRAKHNLAHPILGFPIYREVIFCASEASMPRRTRLRNSEPSAKNRDRVPSTGCVMARARPPRRTLLKLQTRQDRSGEHAASHSQIMKTKSSRFPTATWR